MTTTTSDLARVARIIADEMALTSPVSAGIIRRLAAIVDDRAAQLGALKPAGATTDEGCPVCGCVVEQPARGRRRVYCTEDHRRQANVDRRRAAQCA